MCPKTCHAFTGPLGGYNACTNCKSPRYDPSKPGQKVPLKQFYTFPLGPMLQAQYRTPEGAKRMRYRHELTEDLLEKLEAGNGCLDEFTDFFYGEDYLNMARDTDNPLTDDDVFVQLSIDGAQLYRDKASDCWFFIWIIMDLSPGTRYKKKYVLPGGFVPGPEKPVNTESFLLPSFRHVSALQKEGLKVWNGLKRKVLVPIQLVFRFWTAVSGILVVMPVGSTVAFLGDTNRV
ncbi:hypothetical protein BDN72DRAFT_871586 [Pluteus cervinus]|uniref:Uncharacterized protein n=1 Tax=Pluteus cervinus TaxID=181527 RepID=A0ACD3AK38_9AGAR|nr:hypothetical protein BDN72DRAFT_871586 [Pluteus cervinus]